MNREQYLAAVQPHYSGYQELHVHTVGSFRDAANSVSDVFDAAEELGRNAVAITDHGNWTRLFPALKERTKREKKALENELKKTGIAADEISKVLKAIGTFDSIRNPTDAMLPYIEKYGDAFVAAVRNSVQFVPGVEMYETLPGEFDERYWHIILLAKDWTGMQELFKLCNLAQLNKRNGQPCCTTDTLRMFFGPGTKGYGHIIVTSACMGGKIPSTLLSRFHLEAKINELTLSKSKLVEIDPHTVEAAETAITVLNEEIAKLRETIVDTKAVATKKYAAAIKRAQKALEKERAKQSETISMFDDVNTSLAEAQKKLEVLLEEQARSQAAAKKVIELTEILAKKKEELKRAKEAYATLEKAYRPAARVDKKIEAIQEKINSLGDLYEKAKAYALEYQEILGKGNFYLELQDHGIDGDMLLISKLIQLSRETGIPMTVANDVHYKNKAAQRKRDIIAALRFPDMTVDDVANRVGNDQLYFKTNEEMAAMFSQVPEALENTSRIAEQCNVFYHKEMHLPQFVAPSGWTPAQYLRKMAIRNIMNRYPDCKTWSQGRKDAFKARLDYELGVIENMGFSSYISIVEDFIRYTKEHYGTGSVGPGRGSGAGSLVCYLVGITNIDPLKYGLIFERFLNPERVSMPKQYWATIVNPITQGCAA